MTKIIPKEKKWEKAKWLSEEGLQMSEEKKKQKASENGKDIPTKCKAPKNSQERLESLLKWTM